MARLLMIWILFFLVPQVLHKIGLPLSTVNGCSPLKVLVFFILIYWSWAVYVASVRGFLFFAACTSLVCAYNWYQIQTFIKSSNFFTPSWASSELSENDGWTWVQWKIQWYFWESVISTFRMLLMIYSGKMSNVRRWQVPPPWEKIGLGEIKYWYLAKEQHCHVTWLQTIKISPIVAGYRCIRLMW